MKLYISISSSNLGKVMAHATLAFLVLASCQPKSSSRSSFDNNSPFGGNNLGRTGTSRDARPFQPKLVHDDFDLNQDVPADEEVIAGATVAIFHEVGRDNGGIVLPTTALEQTLEIPDFCDGKQLCPGTADRFEDLLHQPSGARCSGVLVGKDLVATAQHCGDTKSWSEMRFVFGYTNGVTSVSLDHCYRGEIVASASDAADWALIKLDGAVASNVAKPVSLGSVTATRTAVYSYGHHLGLPRLRSGEDTTTLLRCKDGDYTTSLDRFEFASGSPVYDDASDLLIGLLRHSIRDFEIAQPRGCCYMKSRSFPTYTPQRCATDVVPVSHFQAALGTPSVQAPSVHADQPREC